MAGQGGSLPSQPEGSPAISRGLKRAARADTPGTSAAPSHPERMPAQACATRWLAPFQGALPGALRPGVSLHSTPRLMAGSLSGCWPSPYDPARDTPPSRLMADSFSGCWPSPSHPGIYSTEKSEEPAAITRPLCRRAREGVVQPIRCRLGQQLQMHLDDQLADVDGLDPHFGPVRITWIEHREAPG